MKISVLAQEVVILLTACPLLSTGGPLAQVVGIPMSPGVRMEPYFAEEDAYLASENLDMAPHGTNLEPPKLERNITVNAGQTAYMECKVRNLGAKQVSWVRHKDIHILSLGSHTFTSDSRFSALAQEDSGLFTLILRDVHKGDEGAYECQISTKPTKVFVINLFVSVPVTQILGDTSIHVEKDSALNLTCTLSAKASFSSDTRTSTSRDKAPSLVWYKEEQELMPKQDSQLSIRSSSGRTKGGLGEGREVVSSLFIPRASVEDSGNYTCKAIFGSGPIRLKEPDFATDAVKVHVLDGESPNAWKTNSSSTGPKVTVGLMAAFVWLLLAYAP